MKTYKFLLLALSGCLLASCSKVGEELDSTLTEKKWRAMFITGRCYSEWPDNDLHLEWYGVNDAAGYVIQTKYKNGTFDAPIFADTLPPDQNQITIEDLQYGSEFMTRIKVLSPRGPAYDSEWFGDGPGGDNEMYLTVRARYTIPKVITVSYVTTNSLRVYLTLSDAVPYIGADGLEHHTIPDVYGRANGEYIVDSLVVAPKSGSASGAVTVGMKLTQEDKDRGYVDIEGLSPNTLYAADVFNTTTPDMRKWDRYYNTVNVRTKGDGPGVVVLIPWVPNAEDQSAFERGLCRIDTILLNYYNDPELPEGTVFELEPGKKYYIGNWYNPGGPGTTAWGVMPIEKGFTLRTQENPDGTIAGNGQKARMIHTYGPGLDIAGNQQAMRRGYWQYGRDSKPGDLGQLMIGEIIFKNLSCEAGEVTRGYFSTGTTWIAQSPNLYFACNEGTPMAARIEKWEMESCDFVGFVSGIFKTKAKTGKVLDSLVVNNCTFYGGGYSANDGGGNSFFRDDSGDWKSMADMSTSNMFKNFIFTNNTIWDNPLGPLVDHNTAHGWGPEISWNIVIENNTFINFAPLATGTKGMYFDLNNPPPDGGKLTVKKNLFVMTQAKIDWAAEKKGGNSLFSLGMRVQLNDNGRLTFDFADNYCTSEHIFKAYPFSNITTGAGAGTDPIKENILATELFMNPNVPESTSASFDRPDINACLKYQNTAKVKSSQIYLLGIGDPRWRTGVTP